MALGGEGDDLWEAGLEHVEGLGNQARALLFVGRLRQLGVEVEGDAHRLVLRFLA